MSELPNVEVKYPGEYIFRTGQALPAKPRADVAISGLIDAPSRFYLSKKELYDWRRGHVRVTADEITLIWGEHETEGRVEVCGELTLNKDLQNFKINKQHTYSHKELSQFLKMNRVWFADKDENIKVVSNLERFKARVTQEIESGNDMKGNKKYLFEQNVTHELQLKFTLSIPVYDRRSLTFEVEILFDITDGNTKLWLESRELAELMQKEKEAIIQFEVSKFNGGPVVIYQ